MAEVEIYTTPFCSYCQRAKRLLDDKGVPYTEVDLSIEPDRRQEMIQRAEGRHTMPQVFIDGTPVGGCDEIHALEAAGRLDPMLGIDG